MSALRDLDMVTSPKTGPAAAGVTSPVVPASKRSKHGDGGDGGGGDDGDGRGGGDDGGGSDGGGSGTTVPSSAPLIEFNITEHLKNLTRMAPPPHIKLTKDKYGEQLIVKWKVAPVGKIGIQALSFDKNNAQMSDLADLRARGGMSPLLREVYDLAAPIPGVDIGKALTTAAALALKLAPHADACMMADIKEMAPRSFIGGRQYVPRPVALLNATTAWWTGLVAERLREVEEAIDNDDHTALCLNPDLWWMDKFLRTFGPASTGRGKDDDECEEDIQLRMRDAAQASFDRLTEIDDRAGAAAACDDAAVTLLVRLNSAVGSLGSSASATAAVRAALHAAKALVDKANEAKELASGDWSATSIKQWAAAADKALQRANRLDAAVWNQLPILRYLLQVYDETAQIGCAKIVVAGVATYVSTRVLGTPASRLRPADAWAGEGEWPAERVNALRARVRARGPMGTVGGYRGVRGLGEVGRRWKRVAEEHKGP